jgi:hypothetical protein
VKEKADRKKLGIRLVDVKEGDRAVKVQLWEPIELGSKLYVESPLEILVPARRVRVVDISMEDAASRRSTSLRSASATATSRFKLAEDSLDEIRAEMPAVDDEWEWESIMEWRQSYR